MLERINDYFIYFWCKLFLFLYFSLPFYISLIVAFSKSSDLTENSIDD